MAEIDKLTVKLVLDTDLLQSLIEAVVEISEKADALVAILAAMRSSGEISIKNAIVLGVDGEMNFSELKSQAPNREFR